MTDYVNSVIASVVSAICTKTSVAPLERLKVLKQSQIYYNRNNYNKSFLDSVRYIRKNEGLKGLYRGNMSNLIRVTPTYMLKFPLNEYYRGIFGVDTFENLLKSGISAGLTQTIITYPLDMMRTRMSLDNKMTNNYNGYYRCARNIIANEGFRALYKGCLINFTTYPLYVGLQFSIYDSCKEEYGIFSGTIAGVIAQSLMFPGDTIKRQMQINGLDNSGNKMKGVIDCIRYILRNWGALGFYQGYGINMIKVMPEATIQFMTYDFVRRNLIAKTTSEKEFD